MKSAPIRLSVVLTHPIQYYAPWFRQIAAACPELDLTVLYITQPTPEQQGVDFAEPFLWDVPLTEGYRARVLRAPRSADDLRATARPGVDASELESALLESKPEAVLVPGWHAAGLRRSIEISRRAGVPLLYRGDSTLASGPSGLLGVAWRARTSLRLRAFEAFLVTGTRSREYLRSFGVPERRLFDSPHAVDNALFAAGSGAVQEPAARASMRAGFGLAADDFVVLFVGKLIPVKRPLDAIRAVARLGPSASLAMVGAGALEGECREEAQRLGARVAWLGFRNQSELGSLYGIADAVVLPSASETFGLVVNEALAAGVPCAVSESVGSAPDLIVPGETGELFPVGDVEAAARALGRLRDAIKSGSSLADPCRRKAAAHSFEQATLGLLTACRAVARQQAPRPGPEVLSHRVVVCAEGLVVVAGLERMTFEVVKSLRERGAEVHCLVNSWENHRIIPLAESAGASWSTGASWERLERHTRNPARILRMLGDVLRSSARLAREARRFRASHVLLTDFAGALRYAPALFGMRAAGVRVVLRVGNAPERSRFHERVWRWAVSPLVSLFVANSEFGARRLREVGVPERKLRTIRNAVARRTPGNPEDPLVGWMRERPTLLYVGQIAPFKGTHLFVDALLDLLARGHELQGLVIGRIPEWPPEFASYAKLLQDRVASGGWTHRVRFVGERDDAVSLMELGCLLAAPIVQEETFGNVVLEAQTAGLPAVIFPRGGLPELVVHRETGWLCREATKEGLLEGLEYFLSDPEVRARAGAAARARSGRPGGDHDPRLFAERWYAILS